MTPATPHKGPLDRPQYDSVAKSLHWLTVVLVLAQFVLSLIWDSFPRPTRHLMEATHMSFGILLGAAVIGRLIWRFTRPSWPSAAAQGRQQLAVDAVHVMLYGLILLEFVLGFVLRWTGGESMIFFGLQIASPMARVTRATHELLGEIHQYVGWSIVALAAGHAAMAIYHHVVLKDGVLRRMLPGRAG
jgi:cytochrome b561